MNEDSFEQMWSQLAQQRRQTRCPLSDNETESCIRSAMKPRRMPPAWRRAAAALLLLAATGIALLRRDRPQDTEDLQQHRRYAYTENAAGIRVYSENGCSADDVLRQMQETIRTLN